MRASCWTGFGPVFEVPFDDESARMEFVDAEENEQANKGSGHRSTSPVSKRYLTLRCDHGGRRRRRGLVARSERDELLGYGRGVVSQTSGLDTERAGLTLANQEHEGSCDLAPHKNEWKRQSGEKERERGDALFGRPSRRLAFFSKQRRSKEPHEINNRARTSRSCIFIRPLQAGIQVAAVAVAATAAATLPSLLPLPDRTRLPLQSHSHLLSSSSSPPTAYVHSPNCPTSSRRGGTRSRPSTSPRPCRACEFGSRR